MNLQDHILEIQNGIGTGLYQNEAAVSQGIVLRLLQSLGWPIHNTLRVLPRVSDRRQFEDG